MQPFAMPTTILVGFPLLDFTGCSHCKCPHITDTHKKANETPYPGNTACTGLEDSKWRKLFPGKMGTCKDALFRLLPWNSFIILLNYVPWNRLAPFVSSNDAVFHLETSTPLRSRRRKEMSQTGAGHKNGHDLLFHVCILLLNKKPLKILFICSV